MCFLVPISSVSMSTHIDRVNLIHPAVARMTDWFMKQSVVLARKQSDQNCYQKVVKTVHLMGKDCLSFNLSNEDVSDLQLTDLHSVNMQPCAVEIMTFSDKLFSKPEQLFNE